MKDYSQAPLYSNHMSGFGKLGRCPGKKALQGSRFRVTKHSAEAFLLALGGRRTLGAGSSAIPEIRCQGHDIGALPPSSQGRSIGGLCRVGEVTLPELRVELTRLALGGLASWCLGQL
jgi:hypothetical protein